MRSQPYPHSSPFFASFAVVLLRVAVALAVASLCPLRAQDAKALVTAAVQTELADDRTDHTSYMYRDHDVTPDHDTLFYSVETSQGTLRKKLEDHNQPLSPDQRNADQARIDALLHDQAAQQRARRDSSQDDNQAEKMLRLFPVAFLWTLAGEAGSTVTLNFKPDPNFSAGAFDPEAKVLSSMGGQITIHRPDNHIAAIKGTLLSDVSFFGFFGRLRKGGSFDVTRKEVVPGHWQMTETHVHIGGHALFFKSIGSDEDEVRSDFKVSSAKTLPQASDILKEIH